ALLMAGLLAWLSPELGAWSEAARWTRVVWLGGLITLGAAIYGVALLTFGLRPRDLLEHSVREAD
ncbi:MAG: murein biosynthesis integral membrane protein MurJ, partial [Sedimenticolaceae bacterium]